MSTQTQPYVYYQAITEPIAPPGSISLIPAPINLAPQIVYNRGTYCYESFAPYPAFPQPFVPGVAPSIGYQNEFIYPAAYLGVRYNAAALNEELGSQFKGLYIATPNVFPFRGDSSESRYPYLVPHRIAQQAIVGQVAPVLPQPFTTAVVSVAAYLQQVWPQQEFTRPWPYGPVAEYIAYANGTIKPIPFVPSTVIGVPWQVDNLYLIPRVGQLNYLLNAVGQVAPALPQPFVPPPPAPCQPPQPDSSTTLSWFLSGPTQPNNFGSGTLGGSPFGTPNVPYLQVLQTKGGMGPTSFVTGSSDPYGSGGYGAGPYASSTLQTIFCCICNSGLPCYVRSDYAIWCPSCCSFVPKQFTRMGTTQAPGQLNSVF